MAPHSLHTTQEGLPTSDLTLCPCAQYDYINCGVVVLLILLVFYALALWDRWLTLRMRELRARTALQRPISYGATGETHQVTYLRTPKTSLTQKTPPPASVVVTHNGLLAPPPQTR